MPIGKKITSRTVVSQFYSNTSAHASNGTSDTNHFSHCSWYVVEYPVADKLVKNLIAVLAWDNFVDVVENHLEGKHE
jgi:hypothetical protein